MEPSVRITSIWLISDDMYSSLTSQRCAKSGGVVSGGWRGSSGPFGTS